MDPNLFHLDWDRTTEALGAIVVLSIVIERALSLLFEHEWYIKKLDHKGFKTPIAFLVSFLVCKFWDFDAISVIILKEKSQLWGYIFTAATVAGGSKGSIKLFKDILGWKSTASKLSDEAFVAKSKVSK